MRALICIVFLLFLQSEILAQSAIDKRVDELLRVFGTRETRDKGAAALKLMGAKAENRLLHHLSKKSPSGWAVMSVDAFQYVWTENIKKACMTTIQSTDQSIATLTLVALFKNLSTKELDEFCDPLLQKMHFSCGGPMFAYLQNKDPKKERLDRVIKNFRLWPAAAPFLCQYRGADINKAARTMLVKGNSIVKREAINALIFHGDNEPRVKKYIAAQLTNKDPDLRDRAAEYLRWYGETTDTIYLKKALTSEKDLHTRASITEALEAVAQRQRMFAAEGDTIDFEGKSLDFYREAEVQLSEMPSKKGRLSVIKKLYEESRHDSHYTYGGGKPVNQQFYRAQYNVFRLMTGYQPLRFLQFEANAELKKPDYFFTVPPIPEYFNPTRESYGKLIPPGSSPFADSHHVGDDCAWMMNLTPVVAIADGVVRYVEHTVSWGGIVVIEHKNAQGEPFCSLYAHLDPLICVSPGQKVNAGKKVSSLGRSYKWENGGYAAHLHFGIHLSEFSNDWICGYISKNHFKMRKHKWTDPQKFIKENLPEKSPWKIRLQIKPVKKL